MNINLKKPFVAILMVLGSLFLTASPALADGISEDALELPTDVKQADLLAGRPVFFGDKRVGDYMVWNPVLRVLTVHSFVRPHGHAENVWVTKQYCTDDYARPLPQSECGGLAQPLIANATGTVNGNATLGRAAASILPAATNGLGAATINALSNPCRGGRCGGNGATIVNQVQGGVAMAASESNSEAGAVAQNATQLGGNCGGSCPAPGGSTYGSSPSGSNAATLNPAEQGIE